MMPKATTLIVSKTRAGSLAALLFCHTVILAILPFLSYCHSVCLALCLYSCLSVCLTDFLTSCWHSEQLLFWYLCWKVCLSVSLSFYLSGILLTFWDAKDRWLERRRTSEVKWTTFVLTPKLKSRSVFLSVCLSFCPSVCLSGCLLACFSVFLTSCWHSEQVLFW